MQQHIDSSAIGNVDEFIEINSETIDLIKEKSGGDGTKVINLIKSIEKAAAEEADDPYLIAMAERARVVQESFEDRQLTTAEALQDLFSEIEKNEERKKEQAEKGIDALTAFVTDALEEAGVPGADEASQRIREVFVTYPNWRSSDKALREARNEVTFVVAAALDDLDEVAAIVDDLFSVLSKTH